MAVTLGLRFELLAHLSDIDHASLEQVVVHDVIPRRTSGQQPLPSFRPAYAVAGRLVGMIRQEVGVEVGGVVAHGASGGILRGQGTGLVLVLVLDARRRAEDLVLGAQLLQVALQLLVLAGCLFLGRLQIRQLRLQVFDVALLALSERALAVSVDFRSASWSACVLLRRGTGQGRAGQDIRSTVLRLAAGLRWWQVLVLRVGRILTRFRVCLGRGRDVCLMILRSWSNGSSRDGPVLALAVRGGDRRGRRARRTCEWRRVVVVLAVLIDGLEVLVDFLWGEMMVSGASKEEDKTGRDGTHWW